MGKGFRSPYIGIFLVFLGLFFLLQTLNIFQNLPYLSATESFLFFSALLFLIFYFLSPTKPGSLLISLILLSLTATTALPRHVALPPFLAQTLVFHLLGTAFLLVYLIHSSKTSSRQQGWPLYPALIFYGLGIFIYLLDTEILPVAYLQRFDLLWPLALIIVGVYIIVNYLNRRGA